jgi:cobalt/nickel transport system permease protein
VKLLGALVFLIALATTPVGSWLAFAGFTALLAIAWVISGLPAGGVSLRVLAVLPFPAIFAGIGYLLGQPGAHSLSLIVRSGLSALTAILLMGTTPLPRLLGALRFYRVPATLVLVIQFLFRYLVLIMEQGTRMRQAADCRGFGSKASNANQSLRTRAAGALGVLFARSYERAEGIHQAMLSRGFRGEFRPLQPPAVQARDFVFLVTVLLLSGLLRYAAGYRS